MPDHSKFGLRVVRQLLQLIAEFVQLIALNLPVWYRYRDCRLVDGVQKLSCLDIIMCDHNKVYMMQDSGNAILHAGAVEYRSVQNPQLVCLPP